jgi:hypothetical protein
LKASLGARTLTVPRSGCAVALAVTPLRRSIFVFGPTVIGTPEVHFEHGTYTLLCDADSDAADGTEITINVGGVGQVG